MNILIQHAINNVWCNPPQDIQYIFTPARLTPHKSVSYAYKVTDSYLVLPDNDPYHIFQIGQFNPLILNLMYDDNDIINTNWIKMSDAMNSNHLFIDIYTDSGVHIPRYEVYYCFTLNKNFIIAIKENSSIPINYNTDTIYIKFYDNAYFDTDIAQSIPIKIYTSGKTNCTLSDIANITDSYNSFNNSSGTTLVYVNGLLVNNINSDKIIAGISLEIVYDSSIYKIIEYNLGQLQMFTSTLDNELKYLLHYPLDNSLNIIDYLNDIDIYLLYKDNTQYIGNYYHRNLVNNHRMVSHRDYSLSVNSVNHIFNSLRILTKKYNLLDDDVYLRAYVRITDYNRSLMFDNNRIQELYKLNDSDIMQGMIGTIQGPNNFRVESLENSYYTKLMSMKLDSIDLDTVKQAYGYHSVSRILGDTPNDAANIPNSELKHVTLYPVYYNNSTVYEYDINGLLLGRYHHSFGYDYTCNNDSCYKVEAIVGTGSQSPNVIFGTDEITLPINCDYRVYMCNIINDELDNNWIDITNSSHYTIINGVLQWLTSGTNHYLMIRDNSSFLAYDLNILPNNGVLEFDISEYEVRDPYFTKFITLNIPLNEDLNDLVGNNVNVIGNVNVINVNLFDNQKTAIFVDNGYLTTNVNINPVVCTIEFNFFISIAPVLGYNKSILQYGNTQNAMDGFIVKIFSDVNNLKLEILSKNTVLISTPINVNTIYNAAIQLNNNNIKLILNGHIWSTYKPIDNNLFTNNKILYIGTGNTSYEDPNKSIQMSGIVITNNIVKYSNNYNPIFYIPYLNLPSYQNNTLTPLLIPLGELDIFLNNRSLVEDIDYIVNFPRVVIINKEYLTADPNTTNQSIHVRFTGLPDNNLNYKKPEDTGFIQYGFLSNNNKYNLRDDRVIRVIANGYLLKRNTLEYVENNPNSQLVNTLNGRPYSIRDMVIPINSYINQDSYEFRSQSIIIDNVVNNYLTEKLPQKPEPLPTVIQSRYQVYSPFITYIINSILNNEITDQHLSQILNDTDILTYCKKFEYLLKYDLCSNNFNVNTNFIIIHPTNIFNTISLNPQQYEFVSNVVRLYCNNLINLSPFIQIG